MRTFITLFIASIAIVVVQADPINLSGPGSSQADAVALQAKVTEYIITVRTCVPRVLGDRANGTIGKVETNINKLLNQESKTRQRINALTSTICVDRLKVLLDAITEFTGFESSNCVAKYDLDLSNLVQKSYGKVADYDKKFGNVMRIVPEAFSGRNMFVDIDEIIGEYTTNVAEFQAKWAEEPKKIEDFEKEFGEDIDLINMVLEDCFDKLQSLVNPSYAKLENEIKTCGSFDNSHNPFAIFQ